MISLHATRRRFAALAAALLSWPALARRTAPVILHTFGDSILDCARFNDQGVDPGQLLVRNDDELFPQFKGHDLQALRPARLAHHAVDGSTVDELPAQGRGVRRADPRAIAILTIGGNDLLAGLATGSAADVRGFADKLDRFLKKLPVRPVLVGNVYDPTFGNDELNFLGVDPAVARVNLRRVNQSLAEVAARHGRLVDLHAHFLGGDPSWFTRTIEPSLRGASEVRNAFLPAVMEAARIKP